MIFSEVWTSCHAVLLLMQYLLLSDNFSALILYCLGNYQKYIQLEMFSASIIVIIC